ncbi:hypothetical protein [Nocardioides abyssi]|uniref:Uncharacterized protein n=1 Tax=Nocardioides abyssi TaxID=3058370 RepID=A0ABT8EX48_9ACTN|nr:hypothetical protein [Nocardioides abyssi]MDN4162692.1 hypothetical protein [Nocardioides abyssi]
MNRFEEELHEALVAGAERAPDATGLASAARGRARRRRRTTLAAVAAGVVAAVALPLGVLAATGGDGGSDVPTVLDRPAVAPGMRVESYHQVSLQVPADWEHGGLSSWCAYGGDRSPRVERPDTIVELIGCGRPGLGVRLTEAGDADSYDAPRLVEGDWVGQQTQAGVRVEVRATDEETVDEVLDSIRVALDPDPNGCPVVRDLPPEGFAWPEDGGSVCRYDADGQLVQSELLAEADAAAAAAAVAAAPGRGAMNDCANAPGESVVLGLPDGPARVEYSGLPCSDRGVFVDGRHLQLTRDVMRWALSPGWSGSVTEWVPVPDRLRTVG